MIEGIECVSSEDQLETYMKENRFAISIDIVINEPVTRGVFSMDAETGAHNRSIFRICLVRSVENTWKPKVIEKTGSSPRRFITSIVLRLDTPELSNVYQYLSCCEYMVYVAVSSFYRKSIAAISLGKYKL